MANPAVQASARALVASQISRMPEYQQRWIAHVYGSPAQMPVHVCKIVGLLPKR